MSRSLRVAYKTVAIAICLAAALVQYAVRRIIRRPPDIYWRAAWLRTWCRRVLRILGARVELSGEMPRSELVVANHLSYLDILVFSSIAPAVFVAKMEVKSWPVIGLMARLGGAIFTDRKRLKLLPETVAQTEAALRAGALVVVFPESTTTDGSLILPFRPALFEAAVRSRIAVRCAHIWYSDEEGNFARNLCWFGEVNMVRHLAGAFAMGSITARVRLADDSTCYRFRKTAAHTTFNEVTLLGGGESRTAPRREIVASAAATEAQ